MCGGGGIRPPRRSEARRETANADTRPKARKEGHNFFGKWDPQNQTGTYRR